MADKIEAAYPILADQDHAVADLYGVYNLLGDGNAAPAVFVIDPAGNLVWSSISQNPDDRVNAETILEHLP